MKNIIFLAFLWLFTGLTLADDEQTPLVIDVRTPAEYETGHLPGARNINFDQIGGRIGDITRDKDEPIFLYCKSGRRSGLAKQTLEQLGYSNVVNAGGIRDVLRRTKLEPETGPDCIQREC